MDTELQETPSEETEAQEPRTRKPRHRDIRAARALTSALLPEVRYFAAEGLEVRTEGEDSAILITGCPIVYDQPYRVVDQLGAFEERMLPGVASALLGNADVRFLFNHDGMPMARTTNGMLVLDDRADGLYFTARLDPRSNAHNDLAIAIERGDITQMSCGFIVAPGGDDWDETGTQRSISQFKDLLDVSAVTYPASPTTHIEVARRMLSQSPVESAIRVFNMAAEIRAGKVLSTGNQQLLVDAVAAMHQVLDAAGFDPAQLIDTADDDIVEPDDGTSHVDGPDDAVEHMDDTDTGHVRKLQLQAEYLALRSRRR